MDSFRDFPTGPFGAILCDPPWGFRTYAGTDEVPTTAVDPYPTMSLDDMKAIPVEESAAPDCLLVMWVISSHIPQAIALAEAWGFTFRSLGPVWVKASAPYQLEFFGDAPVSDLGMGYWFRQQSEIALVFGRGSPKRQSAGVRQVVWEAKREHSRKPDCVHDRVEALVGGPYLEMFGRAPRPGWTVWGNDVDKFAGPSS
jgi:N6-adenosine-specific RNA methylase IME4